MKLIGNLLLTICLIAGCLSAATAYLIPTSDANLAGMTINENAGAINSDSIDPDELERYQAELERLSAEYQAGDLTAEEYISARGDIKPIVAEGSELNDDNLERLRAADGVSDEVATHGSHS